MTSIDTILFDWDGTLLDSAPYAFQAFQKAFADLGIALERDLYDRIYSPNWYGMYQALELPEQRWREADELWTQHYGQKTAPLVEGSRDVLGALTGGGYWLGIVTSGSRIRVTRELKVLELENIFGAVVCNEDVIHKKPHPEGVQLALRHLDKNAESCCYVGDSPADMEMGKRAGVKTIGIRSGYPSSRELPGTNPDLFFDSIFQLRDHFRL
ncbi:MAG TPA: HAD family hydrolase [Acidobacteriota bacterium]|nr:HAD family hydrolase [Acidobacteriota bacterium]